MATECSQKAGDALQHCRTLHGVVMGVALKVNSQLWHALVDKLHLFAKAIVLATHAMFHTGEAVVKHLNTRGH